jgi:hypothetical protein
MKPTTYLLLLLYLLSTQGMLNVQARTKSRIRKKYEKHKQRIDNLLKENPNIKTVKYKVKTNKD